MYGDAALGQTRNGTSTGWLAYSVERFYDAPLVHGVACAPIAGERAVGEGAPMRLVFSAHDAFKVHSAERGAFRVAELVGGSAEIEEGTIVVPRTEFTFVPHWRTTTIEHVSSALRSGRDYALTVENRFEQTRTVRVRCEDPG